MRATPSSVPAPLLLAMALGCASCEEAGPRSRPEAPPPPGPTQPTCVYFKDLRAYLPATLAGYRLAREEGSTGKYGEVSVSEAERVFTRPGRQVTVRIVDTSLSGKLGDAIQTAVDEAAGRQGDDETAPIRLDETVGFVRYDPDEERAEANLLVGGRFVVAVTSLGFEGTSEVRRVAGTLDLAGLSRLR